MEIKPFETVAVIQSTREEVIRLPAAYNTHK
jgi:hypothetical protein